MCVCASSPPSLPSHTRTHSGNRTIVGSAAVGAAADIDRGVAARVNDRRGNFISPHATHSLINRSSFRNQLRPVGRSSREIGDHPSDDYETKRRLGQLSKRKAVERLDEDNLAAKRHVPTTMVVLCANNDFLK